MDYVLIISFPLVLIAFWASFYWGNAKEPAQTTWAYCPGCKQDLISSTERMVSDTDFVRYFCIKCNTLSKWDFDFPVPILVDAYYLDSSDIFKHI